MLAVYAGKSANYHSTAYKMQCAQFVPVGNASVVLTTNPGENLLSEIQETNMLISVHVIGQVECCAECLNANLASGLDLIGAHLCDDPL